MELVSGGLAGWRRLKNNPAPLCSKKRDLQWRDTVPLLLPELPHPRPFLLSCPLTFASGADWRGGCGLLTVERRGV